MNIEPPLPGAKKLVSFSENSNFNVCTTRVQSRNTLLPLKRRASDPQHETPFVSRGDCAEFASCTESSVIKNRFEFSIQVCSCSFA
jgi:hypothetical protein